MVARNGADGCVEAGPIDFDTCCPPKLCLDLCDLYCAFIGLLPQGPMWDYWKRLAQDWVVQHTRGNGMNPCENVCPPIDNECPSLVTHALYVANKMVYLINNVLWQVVRESDPATAETTVQSWLDRLEWQNCYEQFCRRNLTPGELSPYEIMGECGPEVCSFDNKISDDLACALNRGILQALVRTQMGGVKNLCWLNWVLEPLGAGIRPKNFRALEECIAGAYTAFGLRDPECTWADTVCPPVSELEFEVYALSDTLTCVTTNGPCGSPTRRDVNAYYENTICDAAGLPLKVYPGVLAGQCIMRSILTKGCAQSAKISYAC